MKRIRFESIPLKWLGVLLPVIYWIIVIAIRRVLFTGRAVFLGTLFELCMITLGAIVFSSWLFRIIDQRQEEIRYQTDQLSALNDAGIALTTDLELATVLQKVADLSRELVDARYGALGVLEEETNQIGQFITSGIHEETRRLIGMIPTGKGLLGNIISKKKAVIVSDISSSEFFTGFPPGHPKMESLIAVPLILKGNVLGVIYLVDKIRHGEMSVSVRKIEFTNHDRQILEMFANQAAIAIENARLLVQTKQLAILKERERFGMDLHDGIIQSIYAIGLMVEEIQHHIQSESTLTSDQIQQVISGLNAVIHDIRNYILDLRPHRFQGRDLRQGLDELIHDLKANTFINIVLSYEPMDPQTFSHEHTVEILHIIQEALTNVRKHAHASQVTIHVKNTGKYITFIIQDNGDGINRKSLGANYGNGLINMHERARNLSGELKVRNSKNSGTKVVLNIPIQTNDAFADRFT